MHADCVTPLHLPEVPSPGLSGDGQPPHHDVVGLYSKVTGQVSPRRMRNMHRDKLIHFFIRTNPRRVVDVDQLLVKNAGREKEMFRELAVEYHSKYPMYWDCVADFLARHDPARIEEISKILQTYEGREEESLFSDLDQQYGSSYFAYRRRLASFYMQYDPSEVTRVHDQLLAAEGSEESFFHEVQSRYNATGLCAPDATSEVGGGEADQTTSPRSMTAGTRTPSLSPTYSWHFQRSPHVSKVLPTDEIFRTTGSIAVVKFMHRSSGMWIKGPSSRCDTKLSLTKDFADASAFYLIVGETTLMKGAAIQYVYDGRMLSVDCSRRTWSLSPPRQRDGGGEGESPAKDPLKGMEELHLHTRKFGSAELIEVTDYNEIRFMSSCRYLCAPGADGELEEELETELWTTPSRLQATAWDIYKCKRDTDRFCKYCKEWYRADVFGACMGPRSATSNHQSWLLPDWAQLDTELRDSKAMLERGYSTSFATIDKSLLRRIFSFSPSHMYSTLLAVSRRWHAAVREGVDCHGNKEWGLCVGLGAAAEACRPEEDTSAPPKGLFPTLRDRETEEVSKWTSAILRFASQIVAPQNVAMINDAAQLWGDGATTVAQHTTVRDSYAMDSHSVRTGHMSDVSAEAGGRRALRAQSAEGTCLAAITCKIVHECLATHSYPSDPDTVHLVASYLARHLSLLDIVKATEKPARLYSSVFKAAQKLGVSSVPDDMSYMNRTVERDSLLNEDSIRR